MAIFVLLCEPSRQSQVMRSLCHHSDSKLVTELLEPGKIKVQSDCAFSQKFKFNPHRIPGIRGFWSNCQILEFPSIKQGAEKLRNLFERSQNLSENHYRRSLLIESHLSTIPVADKIRSFSEIYEDPVWMLVSKNKIVCGKHWGPRTKDRKYTFEEDKLGPPSRAYLKLWELFTRTGFRPQPQHRILELGASPGGWTYVLANLGCEIFALDRSQLKSPSSLARRIHFKKGDAFKLLPELAKNQWGCLDWVMSDLISDTDKLCSLADLWAQSGVAQNFVFTIKFKGEPQLRPLEKLLSRYPKSQVIHLENNKNEFTWYLNL